MNLTAPVLYQMLRGKPGVGAQEMMNASRRAGHYFIFVAVVFAVSTVVALHLRGY